MKSCRISSVVLGRSRSKRSPEGRAHAAVARSTGIALNTAAWNGLITGASVGCGCRRQYARLMSAPTPVPPASNPARPFELHFTEQLMTANDSLALLLADGEARCGIYWIDFADGESYVGQSVSARSRLATHRRRWDDAVSVRFAACPADRLDEFELAAIQHVQRSRPLRNKMLTSRPGGERDLMVTVSPGQSLTLPWDRDRRGVITDQSGPSETTVSQRVKFEELAQLADFGAVAGLLATIIREAIPSPVESQGALWSVSALPSTNKASGWRRMSTLSAGRVEILRTFESTRGGVVEHPTFLNLAPDTNMAALTRAVKRAELGKAWIEEATYAALAGVHTLQVPSLDLTEKLLREPVIIESVYCLVVTLMRQGSAPLRRVHNPALAAHLLEMARRG
jgi:hypothetical protein